MMSEGHRPSVKFVVITHPRCGSTLLTSALRTHPHIRMFGELFNDEAQERVRAFAAGVRNRPSAHVWYREVSGLSYTDGSCAGTFLVTRIFLDPSDDRPGAIGFKLFYDQARGTAHARTVWEYLEQDVDVRIIHLTRRNLLHALVSLRAALETNVWVLQRGDPTPAQAHPFEFSPEELESWFHDLRRQQQATLDRLFSPRRRVLDLEYDRDLTSDFHGALQRVQDFLEVPQVRTESQLRKLATLPLHQRIRNYESLKQHFAGTRFSEFFTDESSTTVP